MLALVVVLECCSARFSDVQGGKVPHLGFRTLEDFTMLSRILFVATAR